MGLSFITFHWIFGSDNQQYLEMASASKYLISDKKHILHKHLIQTNNTLH